MKPAINSKRSFGDTRLLLFNQEEKIEHQKVNDLLNYFNKGDVLVVNKSATMPSSLMATIDRSDEEVEIRLAAFQGKDSKNLDDWAAFSFGTGSWRDQTEERGKPAEIRIGDQLVFSENLKAIVLNVEKERLLKIKFIGNNIAQEIYQVGKPIQYSYLEEELGVWDQQTVFSSVPVSVEPPSASFVFDWDLVLKLKSKGVKIVSILHSAGISSTGDSELDALLPLSEFYEVPQGTLDTIRGAREEGFKAVALGTTVLRALESSLNTGELTGLAKTKITPEYEIQSVDALFSGMHEPETSHMKILKSFCSLGVLNKGYQEAIDENYKGHEYGDVSLLDCGCNRK
jgi:S-adenosylmethionine:tRNA ribosyltransferase-isomerase